MVRYFRLSEDGMAEANEVLDDGLAREDISSEPGSSAGAVGLKDTDDNVGIPTTASNDEAQLMPATGFCHWYAKLVDRFPVVFCVLILGMTAGSGVLAFVLYDIPSFSDPLKGFEARRTEITDRMVGLNNFFQNKDLANFHTADRNPPSSGGSVDKNISIRDVNNINNNNAEWASSVSTNDSGSEYYTATADPQSTYIGDESAWADYPMQPCVSPDNSLSQTRFVFSTVDGSDFFNKRALRSACHVYEEYIVTDDSPLPPYIKTCEPLSIGQFVAFLNGKSSCAEIEDVDVLKFKSLLQDCASYYVNGSLKDCGANGGGCPHIPSNCTAIRAVYSTFHYLLPSGAAVQIAQGTFQVEYTLMVSALYNWGDEVNDLYRDNLMGRHITDGVTKLSAVGGDFKFDLFSDFLISDFKFMAIGMGLVLIIVWVYTGSLFVTLMTIADMVMSLVLSYFLYRVVFRLAFFPFVNVLAVVLVIGVGADDTFVYVDIWKKMREKHGTTTVKRTAVLQDTLHHAALTMFVTSFTTSSALLANVVSSITAMKCLAVYAGCAIIINFVYTVTWLPAIVVIEDKYLQFGRCMENRYLARVKNINGVITKQVRTLWDTIIPTAVFRFRYIWLFSFMCLGIGGACVIFVKPRLKLPSKTDFQVFISSDYLEQYDDKFKKLFDFEIGEKDLLPIVIGWGVVPIDNANPWDPDDEATVIFDKSVNVSSPVSQEWLLTFCQEMRNQAFYSNTGKSSEFCFIDLLKSMMESPCDELQFSFAISPCCNQSGFPYDSGLFKECTTFFSSVLGLTDYLRFGEENEITGLMLSFTSTTADSIIYESISDFWGTIDRWHKEQLRNAPRGLRGGWFASYSKYQMSFFDLQESLAKGTPLSIGLSLGVAALVLLLTTMNLLITFFAMLSIAGTVFVTIASLVLLGWELNILEATVMTLAVGLSVDFTIHYGVAYRIAPFKNRSSRSTFAMRQLTSAITTAALSTFAAGAVMLFSSVLSYYQIGLFMSLVMTISWFYANFFFMSLCRTWGPEGNCTQIPTPSCKKQTTPFTCCCWRNRQSDIVLDQTMNGDINLDHVEE